MKKLFFAAALAAVLCSCSGGGASSSYTENAALGKFPSIYMVWHEQNEAGMEDMRAEMMKMRDESPSPEKVTKLRDKYVALEEKRKEDAMAAATKEIEKLRGRELPFEMGESADFEVVSATITDAAVETGALTVNVKIKAKRDLAPNAFTELPYTVLSTEEGKYLMKFQINPYVKMQIITPSRFSAPELIPAGELCSAEGSDLMLYCNNYDLRDFKAILFGN